METCRTDSPVADELLIEPATCIAHERSSNQRAQPPAALARRPLCDRIQNTSWVVARTFGFQAFNSRVPASGPCQQPSCAAQWVPATALLAGNHLEALLVRNFMPRILMEADGGGGDTAPSSGNSNAVSGEGEGCKGGQQMKEDATESQLQQRQEAAFARAVWELHSQIFLPYEGSAGWCRQVGLAARPAAVASELLGAQGGADPRVLHLLLSELALYFLIYSEAANLRHTPELTWFLFWAANNSPAMERLVREGLQPEQQMNNARERRLAMRNTLQSHLCAVQQHLGHDPTACRPEHNTEVAASLAAQLPSLILSLGLPTTSYSATSASPAPDSSLACPVSRALFCDLCCHGDGCCWTDLVVAPLFTVLAFEVDHMASEGQEVAHRLGYDDINESMCRRDIVRRLLEMLGVAAAADAGQAHGALDAITRLGYAPAVATDGDGAPAGRGVPATSSASANPRLSDPVYAAAFWADHVFVKTHRERRSWLALLRAFYRVYSLQLVLLHATMAYAFAPGSLRALSSAVLTHAVVAAVERTANWWLNRGTRDTLQAAKARDSWVREPAPASKADEG
ncbi:hypothetical protein Agub_g1454, partial [Astrephomene gubernaculifera]